MGARRYILCLLALLLVSPSPAQDGSVGDSPAFVQVSVDLLLVSDLGTTSIETRSDVLVPGEDRAQRKTYTLSFGEGRAGLVDLDLRWAVLDRMGEALLLRVNSRSVLNSTVGLTSDSVGDVQTRQETIQAEKGQAHIYELWVSADLRARILASFEFSEKGQAGLPTLPQLEPVTFQVRALEGIGWRKRPVQQRDMRSFHGKEVGFLFEQQRPVRVYRKKEREPATDASGEEGEDDRLVTKKYVRSAETSDWEERNLSEPIRIPRPKATRKQQKEMRERLERGELTPEDWALLEKEKEEKESWETRIERAELRLQPVFTGRNVLRARLRIDAHFVYPTLEREARITLDRVVDFERADTHSFDLLKLAGENPEDFPYQYTFDVKAFW